MQLNKWIDAWNLKRTGEKVFVNSKHPPQKNKMSRGRHDDVNMNTWPKECKTSAVTWSARPAGSPGMSLPRAFHNMAKGE